MDTSTHKVIYGNQKATNVPYTAMVGPFDGTPPAGSDRIGLYIRISPKGNRVWSYWDGRKWGNPPGRRSCAGPP